MSGLFRPQALVAHVGRRIGLEAGQSARNPMRHHLRHSRSPHVPLQHGLAGNAQQSRQTAGCPTEIGEGGAEFSVGHERHDSANRIEIGIPTAVGVALWPKTH